MTSPVEVFTTGVEAVVVRTLVELACAVVRREGLTPGVDYHHPCWLLRRLAQTIPATMAAPQLTALLQALATLARVGPAWREAFDVAWLSRALSLALSRNPPAWRGWTRGLASAAAAAAYTPPLQLSPQQITHLLGEEDSFFSAVTAGDPMIGGQLDLEKHGALLRPTIAFQWPPHPQPPPPPPHPQPASAVPSTRVGDWPQWPFHDKERWPARPEKAHFGFVAQVNLALVKGCALANATGILPRDGMLYFFVQKGSLQMNLENMHDANDVASFVLQPVQCCVVCYDGSSGDEWPLSSIHVDASTAFWAEMPYLGLPARAYTSTVPASDMLLSAPPFAAHQMFNFLATAREVEDDYLNHASEAGPDRRAPLMLGHCAPPPWMAGARGDSDAAR